SIARPLASVIHNVGISFHDPLRRIHGCEEDSIHRAVVNDVVMHVQVELIVPGRITGGTVSQGRAVELEASSTSHIGNNVPSGPNVIGVRGEVHSSVPLRTRRLTPRIGLHVMYVVSVEPNLAGLCESSTIWSGGAVHPWTAHIVTHNPPIRGWWNSTVHFESEGVAAQGQVENGPVAVKTAGVSDCPQS